MNFQLSVNPEQDRTTTYKRICPQPSGRQTRRSKRPELLSSWRPTSSIEPAVFIFQSGRLLCGKIRVPVNLGQCGTQLKFARIVCILLFSLQIAPAESSLLVNILGNKSEGLRLACFQFSDLRGVKRLFHRLGECIFNVSFQASSFSDEFCNSVQLFLASCVSLQITFSLSIGLKCIAMKIIIGCLSH